MQTEQFNLSLVSARTGIKLRKLRYCLDHELVPETKVYPPKAEVGRRRTFDLGTAVCLTCAVHLLDAGLKREAVKKIFAVSPYITTPGKNERYEKIIGAVLHEGKKGVFHIGDGKWARWDFDQADTGWFSLKRRGDSRIDLQPKVVISIDFAAIRSQILGR